MKELYSCLVALLLPDHFLNKLDNLEIRYSSSGVGLRGIIHAFEVNLSAPETQQYRCLDILEIR